MPQSWWRGDARRAKPDFFWKVQSSFGSLVPEREKMLVPGGTRVCQLILVILCVHAKTGPCYMK
jgi:hypothetical protein